MGQHGSGGSGAPVQPPLPAGVHYVEVAAGYYHVVARRSDGEVVEWGPHPSGPPDVPPLQAGTSYLAISAGNDSSIGIVGATSTYVTFAAGCAGSQPASTLVPRETPQIGKTMAVQVDHLPVDVGALVFGLQRLTPSVPLAFAGMPGCEAHVSLDAALPLSGTGGRSLFEFVIPDQPSLKGLRFYNQAFVLDPAAGNAMGAVVSDAAEGVLGG